MDIFNEELFQRLLKYTVEGVAVAVAAFYLTGKKSNLRDVLFIGLTAATVFLVLDAYAPSIGSGARLGAGFSIGAGLVGGVPGLEGMEDGDYETDGEADY